MKNFDTFCFMVDCSRDGVVNLPTLRKLLPMLAKMGYNSVMLYTEDVYEVEGEPFFGYKRGKYTMAEMKEIDAFAASLGIEMIPCMQTLAHLNAIFRWKAYAPLNDCNDILDVSNEKTYELVEKMFATLRKCFRSKRIQIGMDEAHMVGLGSYLDKNGFRNRFDILLEHLNRVCKLAEKYGFEPIMWNDMFFKIGRGNYLDGLNPPDAPEEYIFPEEIRKKVPENVALCYWDYVGENPVRYERMLRSSLSLSDNVWFAGGVYKTSNNAPHNRLSNRCNAVSMPECIKAGVRNIIITTWGDVGNDCPLMAMLPSLMYAAAMAQEMSEEEMRRKFREITGEDYDEMLSLDAPNYIYGEDEYVSKANFSLTRLYNDPFLGISDLNLKRPFDPEIYVGYAERLHKLAAKSGQFGYLYEGIARLCDVLYKKFFLGNRTRECYDAGDKDGLRKLANEDYNYVLEKLESYYENFAAQWEIENKPYGFEVQDYRLGGLLRRIRHCRDRLLAYCDGKVDRIEELDEPVLVNDGQYQYYWKNMITPGVM